MTEPYYEADGIVLYHGDCLDVMPLLLVTVDAVLADLRADDHVLDQWLPLITEVGHLPAPPRDRAAAVVAESVLVLEGMAARAAR